ncbi:MAG: hypothetical protein PHU25_16955 [Deltaproteobacteria bacterium]|nr:hypothetical protein [Deltaproteobacteria bacterium]
MKKMLSIAIVMAVPLFLGACSEPATDAEIGEMCARLVELKGEIDVAPPDAAIAAAEKDAADQLAKIGPAKEAALKALDAELAAKLAENKKMKKEDQKKLADEYAAKKKAAEEAAAAKIAQIGKEKDTAVSHAKIKAEEATAARAKAIETCKTESATYGVSKEIVQCRIKADTVDTYYNKCK